MQEILLGLLAVLQVIDIWFSVKVLNEQGKILNQIRNKEYRSMTPILILVLVKIIAAIPFWWLDNAPATAIICFFYACIIVNTHTKFKLVK